MYLIDVWSFEHFGSKIKFSNKEKFNSGPMESEIL